MNILLNSEQERFIQAEIANGRYETVEQVVNEALKLLENYNRHKDEKHLEEIPQKFVIGSEQIQT